MKNLQFESERLKTYFSSGNLWTHPLNWTPNPTSLSKNGLFYAPDKQLEKSDRVQCYLCKVHLSDWYESEDPQVRHSKTSPECPLTTAEELEQKYYEARLKTFIEWPHDKVKGWKPTSKKLAKCGFHYFPSDLPQTVSEDGSVQGDMAQCHECLLALDGWEKDDDPLKEHKKRAPNCPFFVRQSQIQKNKKKGNKREAAKLNDADVIKQNDDAASIARDDFNFNASPDEKPTKKRKAATKKSKKKNYESDSNESVMSTATVQSTATSKNSRSRKPRTQKSKKNKDLDLGNISTISELSVMSTASIISTIRKSRKEVKDQPDQDTTQLLPADITDRSIMFQPEDAAPSNSQSETGNLLDQLDDNEIEFEDAVDNIEDNEPIVNVDESEVIEQNSGPLELEEQGTEQHQVQEQLVSAIIDQQQGFEIYEEQDFPVSRTKDTEPIEDEQRQEKVQGDKLVIQQVKPNKTEVKALKQPVKELKAKKTRGRKKKLDDSASQIASSQKTVESAQNSPHQDDYPLQTEIVSLKNESQIIDQSLETLNENDKLEQNIMGVDQKTDNQKERSSKQQAIDKPSKTKALKAKLILEKVKQSLAAPLNQNNSQHQSVKDVITVEGMIREIHDKLLSQIKIQNQLKIDQFKNEYLTQIEYLKKFVEIIE